MIICSYFRLGLMIRKFRLIDKSAYRATCATEHSETARKGKFICLDIDLPDWFGDWYVNRKNFLLKKLQIFSKYVENIHLTVSYRPEEPKEIIAERFFDELHHEIKEMILGLPRHFMKE